MGSIMFTVQQVDTGAGALSLIANTIEIQGHLTANGSDGWPPEPDTVNPDIWSRPGYGGSGGGVLIIAKHVIIGPSAVIQANGGWTFGIPPYGDHGFGLPTEHTGGGGRIKIFYETASIAPSAVIEATGWQAGSVHTEQVDWISDYLLQPDGDINHDNVTDYKDIMLFVQQWKENAPTATYSPMPSETPTITETPTALNTNTETAAPAATATETPTPGG